MASAARLPLGEARALVERALTASGTNLDNARAVADALVRAEADGQTGHGLSRVPSYAAQARAGKVDGRAVPRLEEVMPALVRVDAALGFAYPAIDLVIQDLPSRAAKNGVAAAAIYRSHHAGVVGLHAERLAAAGVVALFFSNTPPAMAFWGGTTKKLGTNPIAFAAPLPDGPPLVIDLALSHVARGKIMTARRRGESLPEGWALDANGEPTTDPEAALAGTMLSLGGAKGAALALMVEVLCAALTGANFSWEAASFFPAEGDPPAIGHLFIAFAPDTASGSAFGERMQTLVETVAAEEGVRLPGARRLQARAAAEKEGIEITAALYDEIRALGDG